MIARKPLLIFSAGTDPLFAAKFFGRDRWPSPLTVVRFEKTWDAVHRFQLSYFMPGPTCWYYLLPIRPRSLGVFWSDEREP